MFGPGLNLETSSTTSCSAQQLTGTKAQGLVRRDGCRVGGCRLRRLDRRANAKIKGCNVIGIAGGKDKCEWLTSELGFDAAVDYKDGATFKALRAAAPKGIDVYFDNVGGDILEACLSLMNNRGRIACCGAISQYDGVPSAHGPRGVPGLIVVKRLIMQGFIVMDYMDQGAAALADLQSWVASGKLKVQEDVIDGIENTPKALIGLLAGENRGKRMVRV